MDSQLLVVPVALPACSDSKRAIEKLADDDRATGLPGAHPEPPHCQCGICRGNTQHRPRSLGIAGAELGADGMSGHEFVGQIEGRRA